MWLVGYQVEVQTELDPLSQTHVAHFLVEGVEGHLVSDVLLETAVEYEDLCEHSLPHILGLINNLRVVDTEGVSFVFAGLHLHVT